MTLSANHPRESLLTLLESATADGRWFPLLRDQWTEAIDTEDSWFALIDQQSGHEEMLAFPTLIPSDYLKQIGPLEVCVRELTTRAENEEEDQTQRFFIITYPLEDRDFYIDFLVEFCQSFTRKTSVDRINLQLEIWSSHWSVSREISFEKRIGLFGELSLLLKVIELGISTDWKVWSERLSSSGLHDFEINSQLVEVKTTITGSDEALIHVFDSNQFEHSDELHLLFLTLSESSDGMMLSQLCDQIIQCLEECDADVDEIEGFFSVLRRNGYPFHIPAEPKLLVTAVNYHRSNEESPFIQDSDLVHRGEISNVSYDIRSSSIPWASFNDLEAALSEILLERFT